MCDFKDLEDFDNVETVADEPRASVKETVDRWNSENEATVARYKEKCPSCRGSGRFISYAGRNVGPCFKCDGKGHRMYKTSPETRQARKDRAKEKRQAEKLAQIEAGSQWCEAHPDEVKFMAQNAKWSDFYRDLLTKAIRYGGLTDNQLAAVHKGMAKAAEKAKADEDAPKASSALLEAFKAAKDSGLKRLKLRLPGMTISAAPDTGRNAGHLYVKSEDGDYWGKVTPTGQFFAVRSAPADAVEKVTALADDVLEQAVMYGKETGQCAMCGRHLEDPESVAAGIGPICAGRWGVS